MERLCTINGKFFSLTPEAKTLLGDLAETNLPEYHKVAQKIFIEAYVHFTKVAAHMCCNRDNSDKRDIDLVFRNVIAAMFLVINKGHSMACIVGSEQGTETLSRYHWFLDKMNVQKALFN
jgi:hypothetical protein